MRLTGCVYSILLMGARILLAESFVVPSQFGSQTCSSQSVLDLSKNDNNDKDDDNDNDNDAWDVNVDYEKEWPQAESPPDPSSAWDALPNMPKSPNVLGIDVSLEPLTQEQAKEIKEEAKEIINSRIDEGIQDIETLRKKMSKDLDQSRKIMQMASELRANKKSEELMNKIDAMTNKFLDSTKETRASTKMAAAASRAMEGTNQGIEMGTWGTLGGRTVVASSGTTLLGSVENAKQSTRGDSQSNGSTEETVATAENRIVMIADTKQDPLAKQLIPALVEQFEMANIPDLQLEVLSPTSTMPLGGNNAACVLVVCTSLSQASSLSSMLDRLLRKTIMVDGTVGQPPTQLVGISTVGTERTDKFPYSMQNMLGKLDQRRQVEEVLINTVRRRLTKPPLDYTLIKIGELKSSVKSDFDLRSGDTADEATTALTAAKAIVQAIAYQPFARNATMCLSGATADHDDDLFWDTAFLCLEGPEIWRQEDVGDVSMYDQLLEYVQGWASILAESGKGLTTPVQSENGIRSLASHLLEQQDGVQLLFLPTKTGKNYVSKDEEREERDKEYRGAGGNASSPRQFKRNVREGGIDVVVEITKENKLRIRARRCNYADDAVVKELSEKTILKRLEDAMSVWRQEHS